MAEKLAHHSEDQAYPSKSGSKLMAGQTFKAGLLVIMASLSEGAAAADLPKAPINSIKALSEDYYQAALTPTAVQFLCDYNKANKDAKIIGECDDLQAGSKVVLPQPRELDYELCAKTDNPDFCRTTYQFLSPGETSQEAYAALDEKGKECITALRWENPSIAFEKLVTATAMISEVQGNENHEADWQKHCTDLKMDGFLRGIKDDYADLDKKGQWTVTGNFR